MLKVKQGKLRIPIFSFDLTRLEIEQMLISTRPLTGALLTGANPTNSVTETTVLHHMHYQLINVQTKFIYRSVWIDFQISVQHIKNSL